MKVKLLRNGDSVSADVIYKIMAEAAIKGDVETITWYLKQKFSYRTAYMYVEQFYGDVAASRLIQEQGICKCGNLALLWTPDPCCGGCNFKSKMQGTVEYGPCDHPIHYRRILDDGKENCWLCGTTLSTTIL